MSSQQRRVLQCSLCQRQFRRTEHLTRHERSHRNEKPFSCSHCDARFTRKDLVKIHRERHHKDVLDDSNASPASAQQQQQQQENGALTTALNEAFSQEQLSLFWMTATQGDNYGQTYDYGAQYPDSDFRNLSGSTNSTNEGVSLSFNQGDNVGTTISSEDILPAVAPLEAQLTSFPAAPPPSRRACFEVSEAKRLEIADAIRQVLLPVRAESDITLPSCLAFQRYIAAFFEIFITSLPFIHGPTWSPNEQPPSLFLAIAAIGASTCGKSSISFSLHRFAQLCIWNYLHLCRFSPENQPIWVAQSLLLVMLFGTYSGEAMIVNEVLSFHSILASVIRCTKIPEQTLQGPQETPTVSWESWIRVETVFRTKFATYIFFSQLNLALGLPFLITNDEVEDDLPCSEEEWHAATVEAWSHFRKQSGPRTTRFQHALTRLLSEDEADVVGCSPLGGVVMLHAIFQHIWYLRQCNSKSLSTSQILILEQALKRWEAMSDIGLQQGPLTNKSLPRAVEYDGSSLLKTAYFTIFADECGKSLRILGQDVQNVASLITRFVEKVPMPPQGSKAAFYCIQVLSMLFSSGVVWTNKVMTGTCSLQFHLISWLHCCIYLSKWLENLSLIDVGRRISNDEQIMLRIQAMLLEIDLEPEILRKPIHLQLLHAWCHMFRTSGQVGIAPLFVQAVREYAFYVGSGMANQG